MRRKKSVDQMRKIRILDDFNDYTDESIYAHVHGILLEDQGSCELPEGHTITLDEWRAQQEAA